MARIKVTSKRQATLPKELCDEMQVSPGDTLFIERATVDGKPVWLLRPDRHDETPPWFGRLKRYALKKPASAEAIRNGTSGEGWD